MLFLKRKLERRLPVAKLIHWSGVCGAPDPSDAVSTCSQTEVLNMFYFFKFNEKNVIAPEPSDVVLKIANTDVYYVFLFVKKKD